MFKSIDVSLSPGRFIFEEYLGIVLVPRVRATFYSFMTKFSTWITIAMKNMLVPGWKYSSRNRLPRMCLRILSIEVFMYVRSHRFIVFFCKRSCFFFFVTEAISVIVRSLIVDEFFQCPWALGIVLDNFPFFTSSRNKTTSASNASLSWCFLPTSFEVTLQ